MIKWLRNLLGSDSGKSTSAARRDPRHSEIFVSPPPARTNSQTRTAQARQHMNRAASPAQPRRRDDSTSSSSSSDTPYYWHTTIADSPAPAPSPAPAFKSGGGGDFGGGGSSGGWDSGGGDSGGGGGDGGGGGGGGDCTADFSRDVIAIKLNRRAKDRTLFIQ